LPFDAANIALKTLNKNPSGLHAQSRKGEGLCILNRAAGAALKHGMQKSGGFGGGQSRCVTPQSRARDFV
jgi:hypothetical protein